MSEQKTATTCHPITSIVDYRVEAEIPLESYERTVYDHETKRWRDATPSEMADILRGKIADFESFLRDHRSQDLIRLDIVPIKETVCSECGGVWEEWTDAEGTCCARCGVTVQP